MTRRRPASAADSVLIQLGERQVSAKWVNAAGHMRAAQYVVLFEEAIGRFLADIGCSDADIARLGAAPVLAEMHVTYGRELKAGDNVAVTLQLLGLDARAVHMLLRMTERAGAAAAATVELMILNLGLASRKLEPWSASQLATLAAIAENHADLPRPPEAGRAIKSTTVS